MIKLLAAKTLAFAMMLTTITVYASGYEFRTGDDGKSYWYEDGVRQGTYDDPKGVL